MTITSLLTASMLVGTCANAMEETSQTELTRRIERLEKQNATLRVSYAQARKDADEASTKLAEIRARMDALGGAALGNSEERLVQAVSDLGLLNQRVQKMEQVSVKLSGSIIAYMKQAISEDSGSRSAVESSLRELDSILGFRQQPARDGAGNLAESLVLSIDTDSGLLVLNAGRAAGMRVGMPLKITRGAQTIGEAVVTDIRKEVCGALVQKLQTPTEVVRLGDSASVKTID
ncbi:MAG: hypothetical protein RSA21_02460 [Akkermansia sp.]